MITEHFKIYFVEFFYYHEMWAATPLLCKKTGRVLELGFVKSIRKKHGRNICIGKLSYSYKETKKRN